MICLKLRDLIERRRRKGGITWVLEGLQTEILRKLPLVFHSSEESRVLIEIVLPALIGPQNVKASIVYHPDVYIVSSATSEPRLSVLPLRDSGHFDTLALIRRDSSWGASNRDGKKLICSQYSCPSSLTDSDITNCTRHDDPRSR